MSLKRKLDDADEDEPYDQPVLKHNILLKPVFSLDEEFCVHEIHQARIFLNTEFTRSVITQKPDVMRPFYKQAIEMSQGSPHPTDFYEVKLKIDHELTEPLYNQIGQGNLMLNPLRKHIAPDMAKTLAKINMNSLEYFRKVIFFANNFTNLVDQSQFSFPVDKWYWESLMEEMPQLRKCQAINFDKCVSMHQCSESSLFLQLLSNTKEELNSFIQDNEKLASLAMVVFLLTPPPHHPLAKNRNIKSLRTAALNLVYRYLDHANGGEKAAPSAASECHRFFGIVQKVHSYFNPKK